MRGLKKQETIQFENFFRIVQEKATEEDKVFFVFAGEGNELVTEELECEDLSGWLIPNQDAEEFEQVWKERLSFDDTARWNHLFTWALWHKENDEIKIEFKQFITEMN